MTGKLLLGATLAMTASLLTQPAHAGPVYVALGDSITFGETDLNYVQPAGSSVSGQFGGVLPIGNVHPNATGYGVIAADVAASTVPASVPEPASWLALAAGLGAPGLVSRRSARLTGAAR